MHAKGGHHGSSVHVPRNDGGDGPPYNGPHRNRSTRSQAQVWTLTRCSALLTVIAGTSALLYVIGHTGSSPASSCLHSLLPGAVLSKVSYLKAPVVTGILHDVASTYMLLGAPTSTCWRNTEQLDKAFPAGSNHSGDRQRWGQLSAQDLCTLPGMQRPESSNLMDPDKLINTAKLNLQCGGTEQSGCSAGQLHVLRYAAHAAAHGTARYYLVPGGITQPQLEHIMSMSSAQCMAHANISSRVSPQEEVPFVQAACQQLPNMLQLMGSIAAHGEAMDARWDPTLPDLPGRYNHPLPDAAFPTSSDDKVAMAPVESVAAAAQWSARSSQNYMVGFNLYNNEQLMPHFIIHVLALVTYLPPGHVLVSCYESGSTDSTPQWLRLLQTLLDLLHIPNYIQFRGNLTRAIIPDRIPFLAQVRNQVLLPLQDPAAYAAALSRVHHPLAAIAEQHGLVYPAHKLIFLNDAFFSWQDVVRMIHHDADMVCGLDLFFRTPNEARQPRQTTRQTTFHAALGRLSVHRDRSNRGMSEVPGNRQGRSTNALIQQSHEQGNTEPLQNTGRSALMHGKQQAGVQADHSKLLDRGHDGLQVIGGRRSLSWVPDWGFYDTWVARDIAGRRFENNWPYVTELRTQELLKQGMPFPVQCCWNAAVVVNASAYINPTGLDAQRTAFASLPVQSQLWLHILDTRSPWPVGRPAGLKFRARAQGECDASECQFMCNSLWGLNYTRLLVDPSIRLTYKPFSLDVTHKFKLEHVATLTWQQMQARMMVESQSMWEMVKQPESVMCCPNGNFKACFMDDKWLSTAQPQPSPYG